uniref:HigA2-like helix-turn-helix domain-containing protein n=1 Tax=uncultured prokaryote TaxID=198431 RepID=A0A0H5Q5Z0_9ZZZZ|nr:hypothetical protein [uncultured prokaryote]
MKAYTGIAHITPAEGNVFSDLGFEAEEAASLHAESQRIIEEKLALKLYLMDQLSAWIDEGKLKQEEAAERLGVTRPRISDVKRQKAQKFSLDALSEMLMRAGKRLQLTVQ